MEVLEIIFTVSFMCKDIYSLLDYPKEFFNTSLKSMHDSLNPVSFSSIMKIINSTLDHFSYFNNALNSNGVQIQESDFLSDPMKKNCCVISPRPASDSFEVGREDAIGINPLAKFNKDFALHIKNETLESEGNLYDEGDEMDELDWLRLNNGDEEEYLDMLDRKEQELRDKMIESRHRQLEERRREQQAEVQKQETQNLQEICSKQTDKINHLLDKMYKNERKTAEYKNEIDILKHKDDKREKEMK